MNKTKLTLGLVTAGLVAGLAGGCVARAHVGTDVVVADPEPRVVMVAPGIWVVENHSQAVFYENGHYYRNTGGYWYRSSYYDDGFVRVHTRVVPRRIFTVRSPSRYARYRARRNARYHRTRARRHNRNVKRQKRKVRRDKRDQRRDRKRRNKRRPIRDYRR